VGKNGCLGLFLLVFINLSYNIEMKVKRWKLKLTGNEFYANVKTMCN
jgi:hypothetical protein